MVIIPAKADSKRVKGKNKQIIAGKTLIEHAIDYAKKSKYVKRIVVSTEDPETKRIAYNNDVDVIHRTPEYMADREVADVYVDIFNKLYDKSIDYVVGLQPDNPDRNITLDEGIEYVIENKYDDLVTVSSSGTRNGALRITKAEHVKTGWMSRRVGTLLDNCNNIHSKQDLLNAEKNINERIH